MWVAVGASLCLGPSLQYRLVGSGLEICSAFVTAERTLSWVAVGAFLVPWAIPAVCCWWTFSTISLSMLQTEPFLGSGGGLVVPWAIPAVLIGGQWWEPGVLESIYAGSPADFFWRRRTRNRTCGLRFSASGGNLLPRRRSTR